MSNETPKKPFYKKKWFIAIIVLLVLAGIGSALGEGNKDKPSDTKKVEAKKDTKKEELKQEEPPVSAEFKNALKKAEDYSKVMHMSKAGIYDQLTSEYGEQFPAEASQYAIDNLKADFKENALKKAKDYQDTMSMSKQAIYEQLVSESGEKFTADEAQYAVDNLK